jgi:hypothetical protein
LKISLIYRYLNTFNSTINNFLIKLFFIGASWWSKFLNDVKICSVLNFLFRFSYFFVFWKLLNFGNIYSSKYSQFLILEFILASLYLFLLIQVGFIFLEYVCVCVCVSTALGSIPAYHESSSALVSMGTWFQGHSQIAKSEDAQINLIKYPSVFYTHLYITLIPNTR